ncbi:hypothetical protein [Vannielia litorea]|uniref:hypothetical protein n=1 Tax=Vannielia litorea TaxID=1217970 RepID=UPI001BCA6B74|nr:hypothetical protein [Vannielia litorea]MBS8227989.1 hypothetical protein [Vannielia litorea]
MTQKYLKTFVALSAMTMVLAAPATAQIAKFHMMTPAMPGLTKADRIASDEEGVADFLGATTEMSEKEAASLSEMRDAESVFAGTGEDNGRSDGPLADSIDELFANDVRADDGGEVRPPSRPDIFASADDFDGDIPIASRPEAGRQVVVKTRTKSPRGGSKIKPRALWSVGEFR